MTCHNCRTARKRFGKHRNGLQRFRCRQCSKTFTEPQEKPLDGRYLPSEKITMVIRLLLEGCSVRATARVTGVHHTTILSMLVQAGEKCEKLMGRLIVNVPVRDVQVDETWRIRAGPPRPWGRGGHMLEWTLSPPAWIFSNNSTPSSAKP